MDSILDKMEHDAEQAQYSRPQTTQQAGYFVRGAPWQQHQQPPPPQVASQVFPNRLSSKYYSYVVKRMN